MLVDQVDLINENKIRRGYLRQLKRHLLWCSEYALAVEDADDAIEANAASVVFCRKSNGDAGRIGDAAGFEDDIFGRLGGGD